MTLFDAALRSEIPPLYSTEHDDDPVVHAKLFTPWSGWTWYVTEFDGEDLCFGWVVGQTAELGYFRLSELESVRGPGGVRVERETHFSRKRLHEVRRLHDPTP